MFHCSQDQNTHITPFLNKVIQGDCLEVLKTLPENSVDSIVTDPPYELGFMGKSWDSTGIANNKDMWAECLRVLKPGGHLLAFSGTRTYHRMASAIEDAGFEVRDMIEWVYGSGFPKSFNIGKAVDKLGGRCLGQEIGNIIKQRRIELGYSTIKLAELGGFYGTTNHGGTVSNWETGRGSITPEQFNKLIEILGLENELVIANERELLGKYETDMGGLGGERLGISGGEITKGTSAWEGWGTALKPAHEPICMARKPLAEKTVAENVLKYGTGGINIDESRVEANEELGRNNNARTSGTSCVVQKETMRVDNSNGKRFPANLIHDNSEEVRECFPETSKQTRRLMTTKDATSIFNQGTGDKYINYRGYDDNGGNASRFFKSIIYTAKASKSERGVENRHPTVKPIALMEYLIKIVTPKNGTVLDPFAGSGSTLVAAKQNGYGYIGIELTPEYIPIIEARLKSVENNLFTVCN